MSIRGGGILEFIEAQFIFTALYRHHNGLTRDKTMKGNIQV